MNICWDCGLLDNVFNFDILVFFIFGIELNEIFVYKINFFYLNDIKFNDDIWDMKEFINYM